MPSSPVTYQNVIRNAIAGFNGVQDKLHDIGAYVINGDHIPAASSRILSITDILNSDAFVNGSIGIGFRDQNNILLTSPSQFGNYEISFWSAVASRGYLSDSANSGSETFYIPTGVLNTTFDNTVSPTVTINNAAHGFTKAISSDYYITLGSTTTEGSTLFRPTTFVPGYINNAPSPVELTVTADVDGERIIYIPEATIENGFVTETGMVAEETHVYTTEYNSTDDCVDFIFNSSLSENTGISSLTYSTVS